MAAHRAWVERATRVLTRGDARRFRAWWPVAVVGLLGVAARLAHYAHYRVLWLDEALTGSVILENDLAGFFQPLGAYQILPVGFLVLGKLSLFLLGVNEYAARLPSLVAGLAAIPLFYWLARRAAGHLAGTLAAAFLATSGILIYYSSELKPYGPDVLVAILLFHLALWIHRRPRLEPRAFLVFTLLIVLAPWCSFPAVFLLGGMGTAQIVGALAGRHWRRASLLSTAYAASALSFSVLYWLILRPGMSQPAGAPDEGLMNSLQTSWRFGFMPFPPRNLGELNLYKEQFFRFFQNLAGFRLAGLAALSAALGVLAMARERRVLVGMLLLPGCLAYAASLAKLYPFDGRMILFLLPALYLLMGAGLAELLVALRGRFNLAALLIVVVLVAPPSARALRTALAPPGAPSLAGLLDYAGAHWQEGDVLYLTYFDGLRYAFCRGWYDFPPEATVAEGTEYRLQAAGEKELEQRLPMLREANRVWVPIAYHPNLGEFLADLHAHGQPVETIRLGRKVLYAFDFGPPEP